MNCGDRVECLLNIGSDLAIGFVSLYTAAIHHFTVNFDAQNKHRQDDAGDEGEHLVNFPHNPEHAEHGKEAGGR